MLPTDRPTTKGSPISSKLCSNIRLRMPFNLKLFIFAYLISFRRYLQKTKIFCKCKNRGKPSSTVFYYVLYSRTEQVCTKIGCKNLNFFFSFDKPQERQIFLQTKCRQPLGGSHTLELFRSVMIHSVQSQCKGLSKVVRTGGGGRGPLCTPSQLNFFFSFNNPQELQIFLHTKCRQPSGGFGSNYAQIKPFGGFW